MLRSPARRRRWHPSTHKIRVFVSNRYSRLRAVGKYNCQSAERATAQACRKKRISWLSGPREVLRVVVRTAPLPVERRAALTAEIVERTTLGTVQAHGEKTCDGSTSHATVNTAPGWAHAARCARMVAPPSAEPRRPPARGPANAGTTDKGEARTRNHHPPLAAQVGPVTAVASSERRPLNGSVTGCEVGRARTPLPPPRNRFYTGLP